MNKKANKSNNLTPGYWWQNTSKCISISTNSNIYKKSVFREIV